MKHVGARRVRTMQKPGVVDSVCGERVPRLHLAHIGQSRRLFIADGIAAGIPSCGVNDCEAFVLLLDHFCEVGSDLDIVIRVSISRSLPTSQKWSSSNTNASQSFTPHEGIPAAMPSAMNSLRLWPMCARWRRGTRSPHTESTTPGFCMVRTRRAPTCFIPLKPGVTAKPWTKSFV